MKARGLTGWEPIEVNRPGSGTITATGVLAVHGPGPREEVEPVTGQVVGFVLTGEGRVVPVHYDGWAHFSEGRDHLTAAFTAAGPADRLDRGRQN